MTIDAKSLTQISKSNPKALKGLFPMTERDLSKECKGAATLRKLLNVISSH